MLRVNRRASCRSGACWAASRYTATDQDALSSHRCLAERPERPCRSRMTKIHQTDARFHAGTTIQATTLRLPHHLQRAWLGAASNAFAARPPNPRRFGTALCCCKCCLIGHQLQLETRCAAREHCIASRQTHKITKFVDLRAESRASANRLYSKSSRENCV